VSEPATAIELPEYRCRKRVRAAKILSIKDDVDIAQVLLGIEHPDYPDAVHCESYDWLRKHQPEVGGYVVVYLDGYTSYSPAKAFEAGYTRV
jgi:hypothetical protein